MQEKMSKVSKVWDYFIRNVDSAKCLKCSKTIKCKGGSTSGLNSHLSTQHGIKPDDNLVTGNSKQPKLNFKKKEDDQISFAEEISKMVAVDGFSFAQIASSEFIQESLRSKHGKTLTHPTSIKSTVVSFAEQKEKELKDEIKSDPEEKYCVGFDEWTSGSKKRYINITLYSHKRIINLGLSRITGMFDAKKAQTMIAARLADFELTMDKNVICVICDGHKLNVKYVKDIHMAVQICLNHGLHLAVTDILYEKKTKKRSSFGRVKCNRSSNVVVTCK